MLEAISPDGEVEFGVGADGVEGMLERVGIVGVVVGDILEVLVKRRGCV